MVTSVCAQMDLNNIPPNSERWEYGINKNIYKYRSILNCAYGFLYFNNKSATETYFEDNA